MDSNSEVSPSEQTAKPSVLAEVNNIENQLLSWIRTKGILHSDVQELYRKVCSGYEKIILGDHEMSLLQEAEYCLWKLHYRHIDEFRKIMKKNSPNDAAAKIVKAQNVGAKQTDNSNNIDGLKLFLFGASDFYQNLITKIKTYYGLPEDFSFCRGCGESAPVETKNMQKLQFLCHRFLVCLGDLARYREQYEKSDIQSCNWSAAVAHYLEATLIWPDSGSPQNQLAVLANYVGDEFLALYHCIRSLAVKEPFPDAWNNLILLFERNRSSQLYSLSRDACFDFLKPSEICVVDKTQSASDLKVDKLVKAAEECGVTNLWPLVIRMISFFFIKFSLEDFCCTFASSMKELDLLMALEDAKLKVALESYQHMDSARRGPYRSLQVVSVLMFVLENLISRPETKDKDRNDSQQLLLTELALTATFIFMGRLVDRCLKENILENCPLLPALLVFVEWLVSNLDVVETYGSDDKCSSGMSYFYGVFLQLVKRLDINRGEVQSSGCVALWEDYELQGFAPLAHSHVSLHFSTYRESAESFERRNDHRAQRITSAAMMIANRSSNNGKWVSYDRFGKQFCEAESDRSSKMKESQKRESSCTVAEEEPQKHIQKASEECERLEKKTSDLNVMGKSVVMEEEEVILFSPLQRHNSAPINNSIVSNTGIPPKDTGGEYVPADERLRRATSLLIAQNQTSGGPAAFSELTNFGYKRPLKQQEPLATDPGADQYSEATNSLMPSRTSISSGPPSLNAWVLDRESLSNDRLKERTDLTKHSLAPIEEVPSPFLNNLSIGETGSIISSSHESQSTHYSSPVYSAPAPSAPLLLDNAVWFGTENNSGTNYSFDAPKVNEYSNWTVAYQPLNYGSNIPGFVEGYQPTRRMTSSEWLHQYRESQNAERATNMWPLHSYTFVNTGETYSDISRSGHYNQWGSPLASNQIIYEESPPPILGFGPVYGIDDSKREKLFHGYQRPSFYGCAAVNEPEPLSQYLKEKEWRLQQNPTLGGPAYMGR